MGSIIPKGFRGRAIGRSPMVLARIAERLGCEVDVVRAILTVEAGTSGFLPDGRPKILFERHKFHSFYDGVATPPADICSSSPGGYVGGAGEYARLERAMAFDREAALWSASWGAPQIMGFNYKLAGYDSVEEMVAAFCDSEDAQLMAFATFIESVGLDDELRDKRWSDFARGYNGPNYHVNRYDARLIEAYTKRSAVAAQAPSDSVRELQSLLNLHGFGPLAVDGWMGPKTTEAIKAFQKRAGLTVDGIAGAATMTALRTGVPAPIPPRPIRPPTPDPIVPDTGPDDAGPGLIVRIVHFFLRLLGIRR